MQDSQNSRPKVERFKRLYRTIFDELHLICDHNSEATFQDTQPPAMPVLGTDQFVQLVHDPTIPTCLMNGLDLYAEGLEENQLEDAALERAQRMLSAVPGIISEERLQMEDEVDNLFHLAVDIPVRNLCRSIGLDATYRNRSTERNITPHHAWMIGTEPIAIFKHKSPTVADLHFPEIVSKAQENRILDFSMWAPGNESTLAKVIRASLANGLNFTAILSFIFIRLVQLETTQWQARISDIIPLTSQATPIVSVVLALILHSRNDGKALEYRSLEEEATDSDNVSSEPAEGSNSGSPGAGPHTPTNPPTGGPPSGHTTGGQTPVPNVLAVSEYWESKEVSEDTLASLLNTMDGVSLYWDMAPFSKEIFRPVRREDSSLWGRSLPSTDIPHLVIHSPTDHHITPNPSPPMTPFVLRLNSEIGRGDTGSAYQGCFLDLPLQLVVKILPADCMDRELESWRQLRHLAGTSIPGLFGAYAIEGKEGFADTGALIQQHGGSALSSFDVLTHSQRDELHRIFTRIHEAGVEHGDIGPSNVTLKKDGGVMVIDFGHSFSHECAGRECEELQYLRKGLGLQG